MIDGFGEFGGLSDEGMVITDEELEQVMDLMDEPNLNNNEYDFIMDLAETGAGTMLTTRQRQWLADIAAKFL